MPATAPEVEAFGTLQLPLGGKHGYKGVRGGQGRGHDLFQGTTPRKTHCTKLYGTAQQAAVALAQLLQDEELGLAEKMEKVVRRRKREQSTGESPSLLVPAPRPKPL